jgi:sulfite reductase (NADPH) flavoprotein alpha-component
VLRHGRGRCAAVDLARAPRLQLGDNAGRPLILIGNGSGLAGLLSHIKARVQQGLGDQWLLFGERSPQHDALFADQLGAWLRQGRLARLDQAWSRNGKDSRYVQDLLRSHARKSGNGWSVVRPSMSAAA